MAESTQNKYGAADFERYYSGEMKPAEMNALEKAALEDTFLADALEGYTYTTTIVQDNNDLKNKLLQSKTSGKGKLHRILFSTGFKVAAIFIVFAGLCWVLYRNNHTENELSMNLPDDTYKSEPVVITPQRDTQKLNTDSVSSPSQVFANDLAKIETVVNQTTRPGLIKTDAGRHEKAIAQVSKNEEMKNGYANVQAEFKNNNNAKDVASGMISGNVAGSKILKGKITDSHGEPVPFATIMDKNTNQATSADNAGTYLLVTKDSTPLIAVTALGYDTYIKKVNADSAIHDIVLTETGIGALKEVSISELKVKKSTVTASATSKQTIEKTDSVSRVVLKNAVPVMGWEAFNQYINKKLRTKQQLSITEAVAELTLTFTLNKQGEIKDITPSNDSCKQCVDEAVNVLKGTKYTMKDKSAKATAVIRF